jgi:hypothetical protein
LKLIYKRGETMYFQLKNLNVSTSCKLVFVLLLSIFSMLSHAEIKKDLGDWEVHYIALTSTFLSPEIARANDIERSSKNALINISVLDQDTKEAQVVDISGTARNLLGTTKTLSFKQVNEGNAIYYLASVSFTDKEVLRFDIDIKQGNSNQNLKFQQKMYAE